MACGDWLKDQGTRDKRRQGTVCCATASRETVVCKAGEAKRVNFSTAALEHAINQKGLSADLGRGRRLARNQHAELTRALKVQTLIPGQSRRPSSMNLSATSGSLYVLLLVVPVESCPTAMSLSTRSFYIFLACLCLASHLPAQLKSWQI